MVQNEILKTELSGCGVIAAMASEEDEDIVSIKSTADSKFAAVFDPLDGSSNIDACIPTGTILGIYPYKGEHAKPFTNANHILEYLNPFRHF